MLSCFLGNYEVFEILHHYAYIEHTIDLNARDDDGMTALHYACKAGNRDIVHSLWVICHHHINARNNHEMTPLHFACKNGNANIVNLLLTSNIDLNARDDNGWIPLHMACINGKTEIVQLLITSSKDFNIDLNARDDGGRTALHLQTHLLAFMATQKSFN